MTPEEVKALPLGAPVVYRETLRRRTRYPGRARLKFWERVAVCSYDAKFAQSGIFIGWRTLTDGSADWEDEVGYVFSADEASRQVAALVAYGTRRSPVLVPCDALEVTP